MTVYTWGAVDEGTTNVKMEEPDPPAGTGTLLGLSPTDGPGKGETEADSDTVFEKPLMLPRLMVAVADCPAGMVREVGLALILKSTTLTAITTE